MSESAASPDRDQLPRRKRRPAGMVGPGSMRATAASLVQDALRGEILAMRLRPGQPLSEKALTARFGTSRTPVREALIRLKEDGLVEIFPQAGTFVARIPAAAIPEAVIIRQALECATVELAAAGADQAAIARLDAIIARQADAADAGDQDAFHLADEAFHEGLAQAAGFPGLWRAAHAAKTQIDRCRRMTLPVPGRMEQVLREHLLILDSVRRRQAQAANAAMRTHLGALVPDLALLRAANPDCFV